MLLALLATSNAYADDTAAEIKLLRAKLRELEQRVNAQDAKVRKVRAEVAAAPAGAPRYTGGPVYKGDPRAPGIGPWQFGGVTITPGGFVALEGVYRSRTTGSDFITPFQNIPFNQSVPGQVGEFRFTPRQSRVSMLVQGRVNPATLLSGYGEFDFGGDAQTGNYNQSNSFTPRVRHLYATIDRSDFGFHVLAGQTWSLATASAQGLGPRKELIPLTIDGGYVPGFVYVRQPQIRLIKDFAGGFSAAVSAENPATTYGGTVPTIGSAANTGLQVGNANQAGFVNGISYGVAGATNNNSANTITLNHVPDVIGKIAWDPDNFGRTVHLEGWGLGRTFTDRYAPSATLGGVASGPASSHDTFGASGGGTVLVGILPKLLDVQFSGAYGRGLGRYGTSQLPDVTVDAYGNIKPLSQYSVLAGLTYHALPQLDIYAYAGQDRTMSNYTNAGNGGTLTFGYGNPGFGNAGCSIENSALNCNGNTKLVRQVTAGFWDKIYSGDYGRLQAGMQYSYTQRFSFQGSTLGSNTVSGATNIGQVGAKTDAHIILGSLRYYPFQP